MKFFVIDRICVEPNLFKKEKKKKKEIQTIQRVTKFSAKYIVTST